KEDLPTGMKSPPVESSIVQSIDAGSGDTDALCRATDRLSIADYIQKNEKRENENVELTQELRWEALSWPALKRVCFHLFNEENCEDLSKLAQVSTHYYSGVKQFMKRAENRPAI
ncbi:hypothetical protein PMAYCL1PPCAC_27458, partial [Pristionchus mayeri]